MADVEDVELIYSNFFAANDNKAINSKIDDSDESIENTKKPNFNKYRQLFKVDGNNLIFKDLDISLQQNVILPEGSTLNIKPGTTIRMGKNISLITYGSITASGTKDSPIKFIPLDDDSPWGVVAMVGGDSNNIFENCFFSGGSGAYNNGKYFSGMLSAYHVNKIKISECKFTNSYKNNGGDDAVNIKNTLANIKNSSFFSNEGDAIDVDYVTNGSSIINSTFMSNKNDGIDVSYSQFQISGNQIKYNRDKGISIGEDSIVTLTNTNVLKNKIGIAIKDGSDVLIDESNISKNIVGIGLYNKKEIFSSPKVRINSTIVNNNYVNCGVESTNRFGNKPPLIFTDKEIDKKGNEYRYFLKSNIKNMSKKSVIKEALGSSWKNKSIEYILFNECNL
ncbi:MAG: right-handed parallel beta-helix repeat-containing protein [Gammaproteobacteria bacterium]|nr:right-handed parallel beta-helix repeat-containing protein [Gammaproteobacteria bacterium]